MKNNIAIWSHCLLGTTFLTECGRVFWDLIGCSFYVSTVVWPDWAIFQSSKQQIFLQKYPIYLPILCAILQAITFKVKTIVDTFWATLGKIGPLFIPTPGHSGLLILGTWCNSFLSCAERGIWGYNQTFNPTFFTKSRFLKVQQLEHFFPENVLEIKLINLSR